MKQELNSILLSVIVSPNKRDPLRILRFFFFRRTTGERNSRSSSAVELPPR